MKKIKLLLTMLSALFLMSCASTITTTVTRPAELDLNGAQTVSVMPFQTFYYDEEYFNVVKILSRFFNYNLEDSKEQIADFLTNEITEELINSDFLSIVGSRKVRSALENNTKIPCDVYLTGYIADFDDDIDARWDDDDERYEYYRSVSIKIVYEIVDASTNTIAQRRSKTYSASSSYYRHKRDLPSAFDLLQGHLYDFVSLILKQLQPYEETKYLTLLDDKEKSEQMKMAKGFAKNGMIEMAQEKYQEVYENTGMFQAGYNSAILLEVMGYLDDAEELMLEVYKKTGEMKAYKALTDIQNEIESANRLQNQLNQKK